MFTAELPATWYINFGSGARDVTEPFDAARYYEAHGGEKLAELCGAGGIRTMLRDKLNNTPGAPYTDGMTAAQQAKADEVWRATVRAKIDGWYVKAYEPGERSTLSPFVRQARYMLEQQGLTQKKGAMLAGKTRDEVWSMSEVELRSFLGPKNVAAVESALKDAPKLAL
jgi:hypothetical protein